MATVIATASNYRNDGQRNVAGQFDYYALVLSWSPTYCAEKGDNDRMQCNRSDGRRYSFILHGLWPQYERGYPSDCQLPRRPFVPEPVIDSMLDVMPSRGLVIHEYRAHGTCSGLDPAPYFSTAHRLFDGIKIPERFRNPFQSQYPIAVRRSQRISARQSRVPRRHADRRLQWKRRAAQGSPFLLVERRQAARLRRTTKINASFAPPISVFIPPARSTARDEASRGALTVIRSEIKIRRFQDRAWTTAIAPTKSASRSLLRLNTRQATRRCLSARQLCGARPIQPTPASAPNVPIDTGLMLHAPATLRT